MQTNKRAPTTIDEYISQSPQDVQGILTNLRGVIKKAAPRATEKISYRMPGFYLNGDLVWFAAQKGYIGFYPTGSGVAAFQKELAGYEQTKGSIHFPLDRPLPYDLISRIVKFRVAQNLKK